jgi:hypothetical protein
MIENVMHKLGGVNAFGIFTICLFFAFFIGMLLYAACLKKSYLKTMCELPLQDDSVPRSPLVGRGSRRAGFLLHNDSESQPTTAQTNSYE